MPDSLSIQIKEGISGSYRIFCDFSQCPIEIIMLEWFQSEGNFRQNLSHAKPEMRIKAAGNRTTLSQQYLMFPPYFVMPISS